MRVRLTMTLDVGATPTDDAVAYVVEQYGATDSDDTHAPEEWVEQCVLDAITRDLLDHRPLRHWSVEDSRAEVA
jgi:hypothetical protein